VFEPTPAGWAATLAVIGGLIAFDLWQSGRSRRETGMREAACWSVFYVVATALFGVVFAWWPVGVKPPPVTSSPACTVTEMPAETPNEAPRVLVWSDYI
jgi:hypothetical protein